MNKNQYTRKQEHYSTPPPQKKSTRKTYGLHKNLHLSRIPIGLTCVHENTHGIARRDSTPPVGLLLAGRDPMFKAPSSSSGVAVRKYGTKRGSFLTISRYAWGRDVMRM